MTARAAGRDASRAAAGNRPGEPAPTPGDPLRGPITGRGPGPGPAAVRGRRTGTGRDPVVTAAIGTPPSSTADGADEDPGEGAAEAWLAVLSLHGDFDDDEWAALCGDGDGAGEEAAGGRDAPAAGVPPQRRRGPRTGVRRDAARASNG
ncbi:hypothetical protein [Pseudonocardia abyssalis]|uniref:Uncharacterized protein n=1 Tax=Pseudonocardia abyssalis TaxID=2792008 RepID=A0ABS6UNK7_9PSEU|nr:hypothetical protein [Pseudonocardia abyssalis]MBW0118760.1 hypothetical protein [Pseudonocardia abyssalis]MBW0133789.1 hypothetical protein [Pseudonocardia abyssalis]